MKKVPKLSDFRVDGRLDIPKYYTALEKSNYKVVDLSSTEVGIEEYFCRWLHIDQENFRPVEDLDVENFYLDILPNFVDNYNKDINIDKMYVDFAAHQSIIMPGTKYMRHFGSFYTPYGIRRIDTYFCDRIMNCLNMEDAYRIEKQICNCHHLHIQIRMNLLENLNNTMVWLSQSNEIL